MSEEKILTEIKKYFKEAPKYLNNMYPLDSRQFETLMDYIKQLEANNYEQNNIINNYTEERKKLINELEKSIKQYNYMKQTVSADGYEEGYYKGHISEAQEILQILKGENDDSKF